MGFIPPSLFYCSRKSGKKHLKVLNISIKLKIYKIKISNLSEKYKNLKFLTCFMAKWLFCSGNFAKGLRIA